MSDDLDFYVPVAVGLAVGVLLFWWLITMNSFASTILASSLVAAGAMLGTSKVFDLFWR